MEFSKELIKTPKKTVKRLCKLTDRGVIEFMQWSRAEHYGFEQPDLPKYDACAFYAKMGGRLDEVEMPKIDREREN